MHDLKISPALIDAGYIFEARYVNFDTSKKPIYLVRIKEFDLVTQHIVNLCTGSHESSASIAYENAVHRLMELRPHLFKPVTN